MKPPRCPVCHNPIRLDDDAVKRWRPFCSERCQQLDLAKWLDGDYAIPGPPVDVLGEDPDRDR